MLWELLSIVCKSLARKFYQDFVHDKSEEFIRPTLGKPIHVSGSSKIQIFIESRAN